MGEKNLFIRFVGNTCLCISLSFLLADFLLLKDAGSVDDVSAAVISGAADDTGVCVGADNYGYSQVLFEYGDCGGNGDDFVHIDSSSGRVFLCQASVQRKKFSDAAYPAVQHGSPGIDAGAFVPDDEQYGDD